MTHQEKFETPQGHADGCPMTGWMTDLDRYIAALRCASAALLIGLLALGVAITANKAISKLAAYQVEVGR